MSETFAQGVLSCIGGNTGANNSTEEIEFPTTSSVIVSVTEIAKML
ncbi:hypothetical protein [Candidatus Nitrosocosmicus sp. T]